MLISIKEDIYIFVVHSLEVCVKIDTVNPNVFQMHVIVFGLLSA